MLAEAEVAHREAVDRLGRRADEADGNAEQRDWQLGQALRRAADAPSRCAEVAADTAELGAETAGRCEPGCRPDAIAACVLAEAAARIFEDLVEVNLALGTDERLRADAAAAARRARAARERASAS
jgi:formiminotetrahydrofolate cyclodeaminase